MINPERISEAIGRVDDACLIEADELRGRYRGQEEEAGAGESPDGQTVRGGSGKPEDHAGDGDRGSRNGENGRKRRRKRISMAVLAACICLLVMGVYLTGDGKGIAGLQLILTGEQEASRVQAAEIVGAAYPETALYQEQDQTEWARQQQERRALAAKTSDIAPFTEKILTQLLGSGQSADVNEAGQSAENLVCSPLNLYLAVSMLAEITEGDGREQVLALLGMDSLESLRSQNEALWRSNYIEDGVVTSLLANSLWLSDQVSYHEDTLQVLADHYFASSYRGVMGSEEYNQILREWINDNTGGLLQETTDGIVLDQEAVLALVSTIYFHAGWSHTFPEEQTAEGVFHSPEGDRTVPFMHTGITTVYIQGENFGAVDLALGWGSSMWIILPREGVAPVDLMADEEALAFLERIQQDPTYEWEDYYEVTLSLPKFDVVSELELSGTLEQLGIRDVFDEALADFSPVTDDVDPIYVSEIRQAARVSIDEEGLEAAGYTMVAVGGIGGATREIDFTVDRPFLFLIISDTGAPLFAGVVNTP